MTVSDYMQQHKIVVIVRRIYGQQALQLAKALKKGGIRMMEVTFDQADPDCIAKTGETIAALRKAMKGRMKIGAGTVLTEEQVNAAHAAGAEYIISPNVNEVVIRRTKALGLLSMPGAMTPTEIIAADEFGADFVKIFPVINLGLAYIKNIRGPISHIKFMATGGVNEQNFADMLAAGFSGAGISGRLTDKGLLEAGDFEELTRRAKAFVDIAQS